MDVESQIANYSSVCKDGVMIGVAGDVMLGRLVNERLQKSSSHNPWGNVLGLLKATDINLINLENAFTTSDKKVPKVFNFKADSDKIRTLTDANINVVSLANNHILDFSEEGLEETIRLLDEVHIKHAGAGMNMEEAAKPVILHSKNVSIGLIAFTDNERGWKAGTEAKPGSNYIDTHNAWDREKILLDIRRLKEQVDFCIVTVHWGPNMREEPPPHFVSFAHSMIDIGADLIHGHSAHIFQGIEVYKNKVILYDTGDFVDDYMVDPDLRNDHSFLFLACIDKNRCRNLQLVPVIISHFQVNLAEGEDYRWCIQRMQRLSKKFGTLVSESGEVLIKAMTNQTIHSLS